MATEKRLIDANALMKANMYGNTAPVTHRTYAEMLIQKAPTVDAVEVVRCKDCKHHDNCEVETFLRYVDHVDNPYCASGERKNDG